LKRHLGEKFPVAGALPGYVSIDELNSEMRTKALGTSYILLNNGGLPLEGRVNPSLHYVMITVKSVDDVSGYVNWATDPFGNYVQTLSRAGGFDFFKKELERLSKF